MSYHGNTLGALSVSGLLWRKEIYAPMMIDCTFISPCYAYRFKHPDETESDYGARLAKELAEEIERQGQDQVAAFILETVAGASIGCAPPVEGYLKKVRAVCDHYGVLLIVDEVMCGMGRCGELFAIAAEGVTPDMITFAKGLGAGIQPIATLLVSESVVKPILNGTGMLAHGHTYMNHPVTCAAALAVLDTIDRDDLLANVRSMGALLEKELHRCFEDLNYVGDIRGRGLFWAIEFVSDKRSKEPFPRSQRLAENLKQRALENGFACYPSPGTADGRRGDHVLIAPPFIVTAEDIAEIVRRLEKALAQCLA
jgi:adenosylmethionine-8-amino-7-oxononanoate aminotransferase